MNALQFLKALIAIMTAQLHVELADRCYDRAERDDLFLPGIMSKTHIVWSQWLQARRGPKHQGYCVRTVSSLASHCKSRPDALQVFAREAYKLYLQGIQVRAMQRVQEVKDSPHNNATEQDLVQVYTNYVSVGMARLNQLVKDCSE